MVEQEARKPHVPSSSSPITLLPRPIMLGTRATRAIANKNSREQSNGSLLSFIARFLETNGFSRTLSVFRSEARLEDGVIGSSLDMEEMLGKFLESSTCSSESYIGGHKEQDSRMSSDFCEEPTMKKKKKKGDGIDEAKGRSTTEADDNVKTAMEESRKEKVNKTLEPEVDASLLERKAKKKRKKSFIGSSEANSGGSSMQEEKEIIGPENLFNEPQAKSKSKKKKASITCSPLEDNVVQVPPENLCEFVEGKLMCLKTLLQNDLTELDRSGTKPKGRKKKEINLDFSAANSDEVGLQSSHEMSKEKSFGDAKTNAQISELSVENAQGLGDLHYMEFKSKCKKRKKKTENLHSATKWLDEGTSDDRNNESSAVNGDKKGFSKTISENECNLVSDEVSESVEHKKSKKRKWYPLRESPFDKEVSTHESKQRNSGGLGDYKNCFEAVNEDEKLINKKRKTDKDQEISCISSNVQPVVLVKDNEKARENNGQNNCKGHKQTSGKHSKNDNSGTPLSKTLKTEQKLSAEPETIKAFQRVKIDKAKLADERLQSNSYWAKDGADNAYGAKAQEILGQVRGRDFRHEKTKKGSYRGGRIDLQSHSIKFNYFDEDNE